MNRKFSLFSALFALVLVLLILTCAIAMPIYLRPFYYAHIEPMNLSAVSGYTADQIKAGYDAILDYLTLPGREFSAGDFAYSPEGAAHFADCKVLFDLNRNVLLASLAVLLALDIFRRAKNRPAYALFGRPAALTAGIFALALPIVLGSLAALDFDRAFVIFHSIFFPGKENWIFDWHTDHIIRVLPQDFFMHCGILLALGVVVFSLAAIACGLIQKHRKPRVQV